MNFDDYKRKNHNSSSLNSRYDKNKLDFKYESDRPQSINNDSRNNYNEPSLGIDTINSTRGGHTPDIHGIPNSRGFVNPWLMSSL